MNINDFIDMEKKVEPSGGRTATSAGRATYDELVNGINSGWVEGNRNAGLTRLAGVLRSCGLGEYLINSLLGSVNRANSMNLSPHEIDTISRSVSKYQPKPELRVPREDDLKTIKDCYEQWLENKKYRVENLTGYERLDSAVPVFAIGEVLTVAGRSGTCKTTFGLQLGNKMAKRLGSNCLFMSLEMNLASIYIRLSMGVISEYDNYAVDSGEVEKRLTNDAGINTTVMSKYEKMVFVEKDTQTLEQIEEYVIKSREKYGDMPTLVIDYLGYIGDTEKGSVYEKVSRIVRAIKGLAKRQKLRIILLCQTSRNSEDGTTPVKLHHLRDSGAIEESADHILGLWHSKSDKNRIHCQVLKTRHSERGSMFDFINNGLNLIEDDYIKDTESIIDI